MGDIVTDAGVVSEFAKFLTAQLKESRDEIQRLKQENASLKERLSAGRATPHAATDGSLVAQFRAEATALQKERDDALALAKMRQLEADAWKTRYEQLKPQLSESAAMSSQLLGSMRQELVQFIAQQPGSPDGDVASDGRSAAKFCEFIASLPATAVPDSLTQEPHIAFRGATKLPLLSKAAVKTCIGGFAFFGTLLVWCAPASQHAYVMFPEYEYNAKPTAEGATSWSKTALDWASFAGQQRELFYVDGDNISYAGTFICHAGPRGTTVAGLGDTVDEMLLGALARKTFHLDTKNPKTRSNLSKTYTPLLTDLYRDSSSSATVQLLGLQRVGFNKALFDILTTANRKRDRAAALADLPGEPNGGAESSSKRGRLDAEESVAMETDI